MPSVFTIHNVAYQGQFGMDTLGLLGLPWNLGTSYALEYHGSISYLKGGTVFAELVNTVSPTYALEIQGAGARLRLRRRRALARAATSSGILNGVDYDEWDPRADRHIARALLGRRTSSGKAACKADLLRAFGLPEFPDLPLVGVTSRLVWQKGFDIVAGAWWDFLQRPLRMVVLGHRRPRRAGGAAPPPAARPRPLRGALRLRRGASRTRSMAGRRHVPDAVAQRAVRPHADVRAALRDGPDRARDRRPRRHRRAVRRGEGHGHRASGSTRRTARGSCGRSTRRSPPGRTARPGRPS